MELGINLVTPACYRDATDSGGPCVTVGLMGLIDDIFKRNLAIGLVMSVGALIHDRSHSRGGSRARAGRLGALERGSGASHRA
jgi:hypothetical protein